MLEHSTGHALIVRMHILNFHGIAIAIIEVRSSVLKRARNYLCVGAVTDADFFWSPR